MSILGGWGVIIFLLQVTIIFITIMLLVMIVVLVLHDNDPRQCQMLHTNISAHVELPPPRTDLSVPQWPAHVSESEHLALARLSQNPKHPKHGDVAQPGSFGSFFQESFPGWNAWTSVRSLHSATRWV